MTTEHDLTRTLREHADDVLDTPLTLDDVRGRARSIRRRRAAGALAALAVVVAVAAPVALLSGDDRDAPDPAPMPTHAVDPNGDGLPFLYDGVLTYDDGPRFPLRLGNAQVLGFTPLGTDRYVVSSLGDNGTEIALLNEQGNGVDHFPSSNGGLAVNADRTAVAWIARDGTPQLLIAGDDTPQTLDRLPGEAPVPVAITGDCAVVCEVIGRYETADHPLGSSWAASSAGSVRVLLDNVPFVMDASPDGSMLAALDGYADDDIHVCGGVFDVGAADYLWHGCEDNVYRFSPDGALVATAFAEGRGPSYVTIRDAHSGIDLYRSRSDWVPSFAWEDATHLLVVEVADDGSTSLQRIDVDGGTTTVLDGLHTDMEEMTPAIMLPSP